jgi:hypothetical protein
MPESWFFTSAPDNNQFGTQVQEIFSSVLLWSEQEERSEHAEDQVREEAERGEIDVELAVVRSE